MLLLVSNQTDTRIPKKSLKKLFDTTLKILGKREDGAIELTFINVSDIQKLNRKHRKKNKPTDVLSFEYPQKKNEGEFFGQIIIAPEVAKEQKGSGENLEQELNKLFIHGLLHLFGFDHKTDEDFYTMSKMEKRILKAKS